MKYFLMTICFALFSTSAFASSIFFVEDAKATSQASPFRLEFRVFARASGQEDWKLDHAGSVCFTSGKDDSSRCYQSIGRQIINIAVPQTPAEPVVTTNYQYGIEFSEPVDGKTRATMFHRVLTQKGNEETWHEAFPNLLNASNESQVGYWSAVEYQQDQNDFRKLEVRLIPSP